MDYSYMTKGELMWRQARIEGEIKGAIADKTLTRAERNDLLVDLRSILSDISEALYGHRPSDSDGVY